MTLHSLLIDKRIVQRNIEQGKLEPAEYQRILDALPDLSDKVWRRPAVSEVVVEAQAPANQAPANQAPANQAPANQAPANQSSADTPVTQAADATSDPASAPRQDATSAFDASL